MPTVLNIHSVERDDVIRSIFVSAQANYEFALDNLVPLMGKLDIQREIQNPKFYDRLARDIVDGCIMPPLTLAIVDPEIVSTTPTKQETKRYILENIDQCFILDGMQRLNTLKRAHSRDEVNFPLNRKLYLNVLICGSMDLLLYRMITLNNGQKPMTARHQIEIVASNVYDFEDEDRIVLTEKRKLGQKRKRGAFKKVDLIKGYLAFLSESINIDNDKIIQEKMDELIASKIMHSDITSSENTFELVLDEIDRLHSAENTRSWILVQNNLIGFCAGARQTAKKISNIPVAEMGQIIETFENAFTAINISKIKLGNARRKAVSHLIANIAKYKEMDQDEMLDNISQEI
ncbi:hypothetical protein [Janthinobacterium sp. GMG1]|uniref:hypothetical protein n=1 Tax=Janthinobacterium sp. GMG1 TaxID=3096007 RepID=UPI002ACA9B6F|nr:hypothetical protein [Janthinobacterium sp. GMG1]MDZ5636638.1 hypothetical protein [Janthinobacterium sp. GMG1]